MKKMLLATLVMIATSTQALAFESNHYGTRLTGTSASDYYGTHISAENHKLIQAAKQSEQDLYYFQATNGEVITANLLNAIATAQSVRPALNNQQAIEALFGAL